MHGVIMKSTLATIAIALLLNSEALAITQGDSEQILRLPAVALFASNSFLGMGVVVASDGTGSYIVTARHNLHSGVYGDCSRPEPMRTAISNVTVRSLLYDNSAPMTIVNEDRCSDLSLIKIDIPDLPVACFEPATSLSNGTQLASIAFVDATEPTSGKSYRVNKLVGGRALSVVNGELIHSIVTSGGFSGAGILDTDTGLFVAIHQSDDLRPGVSIGFGKTVESISNLIPVQAGISLLMGSALPLDGRCYGNFIGT
jgi:Trypsin-like peptidase domain